ncbi:hypothetical protein ACEPPN_009322 [Leptodophora sp. 'Broadleaf-Isolate-01']
MSLPPGQRQLAFAPSVRDTPQRDRIVTNYRNLERIDEPIVNPPRTPATNRQATQSSSVTKEDDEDLDEPGPEDDDSNDENQAETIHIQDNSTPTRRGLASTVQIMLKKVDRTTKKTRKDRTESTWTIPFFNMTTLGDEWSKKGEERVRINRLWTCKICGPAYTSTDKARHGSTTALGEHIKKIHKLTASQYKLGIQPHIPKGFTNGSIELFIVKSAPIPSAEEAVLQYIITTNQSFLSIESISFQNLYLSIRTTCPISSADALNKKAEYRFHDMRRDNKKELATTYITFSITFDGWGAENNIHILAVIAH